VLLIVMFLAIWQFLSPATPTHHPSATPPPPPCENAGSFWSSTLTSFGPAAILFLLFFWFIKRSQGVPRFNLSQEPGFRALAERRFSDAAEVFGSLAARFKKRPFVQAVALFNSAHALLWGGRFEEAIASLARVEKVFGVTRFSGIRAAAARELVLANALLGDLDTAERWAEDCWVRLAKSQDDRLFGAAILCLNEAVLQLRRGKPPEASASLEKNWLTLRDKLPGNQLRVAEILRAFAEASGGVREYNKVGERLVRIEPVTGNEFEFLGVRWPEMHAFLAAHGLAS
jgi:hypothetical protein